MHFYSLSEKQDRTFNSISYLSGKIMETTFSLCLSRKSKRINFCKETDLIFDEQEINSAHPGKLKYHKNVKSRIQYE